MKPRKILALTLAALTLCAALTACGGKAPESTPSPDTSEPAASPTTEKVVIGWLEQNSIEAQTGEDVEEHAAEAQALEFQPLPSMNTMLLELQAGRVDAIIASSCVANYLASKDDTLLTLVTPRVDCFRMATRSEDTAFTEELKSAIDGLKADGTMDKLIAEYITNATGDPAVNTPVNHPGGETHVVAITGDLPPLDYVTADGTPAGFNVALLNAIAEKNGCNFELIQLDAAARLSALESGKIDLVFWIECQGNADFEPTQEGVHLTPPYFEGTGAFVTNSADVMESLQAMVATPQ